MFKKSFVVKSIITVVAVSAAFIYAQSQRPAPVTTIEYEGAVIILHPDSTWSFEKHAPISATGNEDVFVQLRNNFLWLKPDNTYTFTKTPPRANRPRSFPTVSATASVTNVDFDPAMKKAINDTYEKAAVQLRHFIPTNFKDQKKAQAYLLACLKDEVKENELDQAFNQVKGSKGSQWKVDAKINVPDFRTRRVVECLDLQLQPPAPPEEK